MHTILFFRCTSHTYVFFNIYIHIYCREIIEHTRAFASIMEQWEGKKRARDEFVLKIKIISDFLFPFSVEGLVCGFMWLWILVGICVLLLLLHVTTSRKILLNRLLATRRPVFQWNRIIIYGYRKFDSCLVY